jgi:DNA-directed RNA polymerase subunit H (RpoH/RPB5)
MGQQEQSKNNNNNNNNSNEPTILEQGDIYFFYRPKKDVKEVKGIEDVRRFFMVTGPESRQQQQQQQFYRLFVIGKKSLPEIRKSDARASERYWARVGGIFQDQKELTKELFSDEFRKGDVARPAGLGKYVIVRHQNHAELAYILETPGEPGEAQKELGIEKEASYIISVINPKKPTPPGYPSAEEYPKYPDEVLKEFSENENFVSLTRDTRLIDYQNAQVILVGAREGKDAIKRDLGIDIEEEESSNIFDKLKVRKEEIPIKPLTEGKLE